MKSVSTQRDVNFLKMHGAAEQLAYRSEGRIPFAVTAVAAATVALKTVYGWAICQPGDNN